MSAGAPAGAAVTRVARDEAWEGLRELPGELLVEAGAELALGPGCRLLLTGDGPRRVVVRGRLVARGRPGAPVLVEAAGGVFAQGDAVLRLERARVRGASPAAVQLFGRSRLAARDCELEGEEAALYAAERAEAAAAGGRWGGRGCAARWESSGRLALSGVALAGARAGVSVAAGRVLARGGWVSGAAEAAWDVAGGELLVSGGGASGCAAGARVSAGRARLRGVRCDGVGTGAHVGAGASLAWRGGRWRGGACGVHVDGGAARLRALSLRGGREALVVRRGSLEGEDLRVEGAEAGASVLGADASLYLRRAAFSSCGVGVAAAAGHAHLGEGVRWEGCGRRLRASPAARLCAREDEPLPPASGLRGAVLAARGFAPAAAACRAAYAAGEAWLGAAARADGARAWIHRGRAEGGGQPGLSDLDAVWLAGGLDGADGAETARRFWRRYGRWKAAFPFLGELLLAAPEDGRLWLAGGGARAWESGSARSLAGEPPPAPPGTPDRDASLAEAFVGFTRLCECLFARLEPWPVLRWHGRKAVLDVLRHLEAAERGGAARPRAAFGAASGLARELLGRLDAVPGDGRGRREALGRACAALLLRLDASPVLPAAPADASSAPGPVPDFARDAQAALDGRLAGLLADGLHRSVAVVSASSLDEAPLGAALAAWSRRGPEEGGAGTLPLLLTPRAWRAWASLPYMEHPAPGSEAEGGLVSRGAGRALPGHRLRAWGLLPWDGAASRASARRCAASYLMAWRWTAGPGRRESPQAAAHWLLSRLLGLRLLLERGELHSFFDLDALGAAYARVFPDSAAALERLLASPGALAAPGALERFLSEQAPRLRAAAEAP